MQFRLHGCTLVDVEEVVLGWDGWMAFNRATQVPTFRKAMKRRVGWM